MIRRVALLFLLLAGSSNAIKGLRRRVQNTTTPVTTGPTTTTPPGLIINNDGLPKEPKEPKEEGLLPKEPKDDAKLKEEDGKVKADEVKEKKEKKDKKCKKRAKTPSDSTVPASSTRRSLQDITNSDGLAKKAEGEVSTTAKEPPAVKEPKDESGVVPPPPVSPPSEQPWPPVDDATVEPDVVEPPPAAATTTTGGNDETEDDANAPYCADVGTKSRTQAECATLLSSGPNGKSIKGEVQFEVTYDEENPTILQKVQERIKTRAALKAAGCTVEERRVLRFLQDATTQEEETTVSTLYISGVRFGDFAIDDKCASGLVEGCDNVAVPVEIYYESDDNREATEEEAQIMMENVIKAIQGEEYEGAQIDNYVGEVHTNGGRNIKGIVAGTAVAGAAVVAGAVVAKRYGSNLMAKWA